MQRSRVRPTGFWGFPVLVLCALAGSPQSLGAQVGANPPKIASAIRTVSGGSAARGIMVGPAALYGRFAMLSMAGIDQGQRDERATSILPYFTQEAREGSAWREELLIGAAAGIAPGILAHAAVDSTPCDSCIGTGRSAAEGTRLEFALIFGLAGGGLGAFLGSRR